MNLEQVYDALRKIAGVSSKTEKDKVVRFYLDDSLFAKVCLYAYHPFYHYGIQPDLLDDAKVTLSSAVKPTIPPADADFFHLLDHLRKRELTGGAARTSVAAVLGSWDARVAILLVNILRKDLRAGFTDGTLNRVKKGFVPEYDCMLAHKYDPKHIKKWPVAGQPKLDGVRCQVHINPDGSRFLSRTGKEEFASFPLIERDLAKCGGPSSPNPVVVEGELTSGNFNKTVGDVRRKSSVINDVVLTTFDWLYETEFREGSTDGHSKRREWLQANVPAGLDFVQVIDERILHNHEEVMAYYQEVRDAGGEGIIVKPLDGKYEPKRSRSWLKIKDQQTIDLKCIRLIEGDGKYAGMVGAAVFDHKGVEVKASGFSDKQRKEFWEQPDLIVGKISELEFHEITPDNSLRHPRFNCVRFDKVHADA